MYWAIPCPPWEMWFQTYCGVQAALFLCLSMHIQLGSSRWRLVRVWLSLKMGNNTKLTVLRGNKQLFFKDILKILEPRDLGFSSSWATDVNRCLRRRLWRWWAAWAPWSTCLRWWCLGCWLVIGREMVGKWWDSCGKWWENGKMVRTCWLTGGKMLCKWWVDRIMFFHGERFVPDLLCKRM